MHRRSRARAGCTLRGASELGASTQRCWCWERSPHCSEPASVTPFCCSPGAPAPQEEARPALPLPEPWAQARCPPRRAEPRAQKILPVPQALTKRFPVHHAPGIFPSLPPPCSATALLPPAALSLPTCTPRARGEGSNSPALSRGDPSPALAAGICFPVAGDCSGRDLRSWGAGEGQRSPELRMLQRPSLQPPAYKHVGPLRPGSPPRVSQTSQEFSPSSPRTGLANQIPPGSLPASQPDMKSTRVSPRAARVNPANIKGSTEELPPRAARPGLPPRQARLRG